MTNGYTTTDGTRRIVVEATLEPAQAARTMLHEAAHATLHIDAETGLGAPGEYVAHRGRYETEAESVAYVLAGLAGLDTAAYPVGYITTWAKGDLDLVRVLNARLADEGSWSGVIEGDDGVQVGPVDCAGSLATRVWRRRRKRGGTPHSLAGWEGRRLVQRGTRC